MTERLASAVTLPFQEVLPDEVNRILNENTESMDGRLMVMDSDGKIQFDTFGRLCGQRLQIPEVLRILTGGEEKAYGVYNPGQAVTEQLSGEAGTEVLACCTYGIQSPGGCIGAVLFVSRLQSMVDSIRGVQWQLVSVFTLIAMAALVLALILSRVLTNPIIVLNKTMKKMGKGDLSVRVPVRGSGELRELAENYNQMAAQLEKLDKTRNQFVSNASHELKTPLATMKIMLESLIYEPDMPRELREEFMQDMNHEIDRLTGIITDLLTLTRLDTGVDEGRKEAVDMTRLTEETARLLQRALEKRGQRLNMTAEPGIVMTGDRIKLNQILYNLLDNAIKYTPDGGSIAVELYRKDGEIVWTVRDNGVGIPEEDQEHIFDRFYRVDKARSRETGGTGLGLSIVRQLVKLEGGSISVSSRPGQGSAFTVRFPAEGGMG